MTFSSASCSWKGGFLPLQVRLLFGWLLIILAIFLNVRCIIIWQPTVRIVCLFASAAKQQTNCHSTGMKEVICVCPSTMSGNNMFTRPNVLFCWTFLPILCVIKIYFPPQRNLQLWMALHHPQVSNFSLCAFLDNTPFLCIFKLLFTAGEVSRRIVFVSLCLVDVQNMILVSTLFIVSVCYLYTFGLVLK